MPALSSHCFTKAYVSEKVESWSHCIGQLSDIAKVHPHATYAAFVHGVCSKWTYFVCTILLISTLLGPLEDAISVKFLPLTGRSFSDIQRSIFFFALGGLGIGDPGYLIHL